MAQALFVQLAVRDRNADLLAEELFELRGTAVDGLHTVVQVVDLPAARKLAPDGFGDHAPIVLEYIGLHRLTVLRRHLDGRHIADARQRHVQCARNGRRGERERVHLLGKLLELFLVRHAEALLLVDDEQSEVLEVQSLLQQRVRADEQVDLPLRRALQNLFLLRRRLEAREHLDRHRKAAEAVDGGGVMLLRQHGGRHQDRRLLAVEHAFHHRAQRDLRFAVAHIAAEQAIHRARALHVALDLRDGAKLIVRLLIVEGVLKLALPGGVRRKGEAGAALPFGVELDKPLGKILRRGLGAGFGLRPVRAAELVQLDVLALLPAAVAADVLRHHIELRRGNVQAVAAGVGDLDIILVRAVHADALHADKAADAVALVNDEVARRQVGVGAELLTARILFLPHRARRFAADRRKKLPLGQNDKAELRVFAARAQRAEADDGLARGGQRLIGEIEPCAHAALLQKAVKIPRARFVAAEHQHAAARGKIVLHVRGGGLKAAAVGRQLPRVDAEHRPRQGQIARGRQAVAQEQREAAPQPPRQVLKLDRERGELPREHALLQQDLQVLAPFKGAALRALHDAAALADEHDAPLRQIVRRADGGRVGGGKVAVHAAERQALAQAVHIRADRCGGLFRGHLFCQLRRGVLHTREHRVPSALGGKGQHLGGGQNSQLLKVFRAALRGDVKLAHRVNLGIKKFDAHRCAHRGIDV